GRQLWLALNRPRALLFALYGQWIYHACRADLERARQLTAEVRDLGEVGGDVATRMIGYHAGGFTYLLLGEFAAARTCLEEGLARYDRAYERFYTELLPYDLLVGFLVHSSQVLLCVGDLDQALSQREAALQEARRLSHPHDLALAVAWAWMTGRSVNSDPKS